MLNIVVARQSETLRWIDTLPEHCSVTVCSDDASQGVPLDVTRHIELLRLPGQHSVGELYLAYLKRPVRGAAQAFTVFCPGDPLAVCPDFLALLEVVPLWADVQPLSQSTALPLDLQNSHTNQAADSTQGWLSALPVTPLHFDLRSWAPLGGFDKTMYRAQQRYGQVQQLRDHAHPGAHFLDACGLPALAQAVRTHDLGVCDRGLLFAVRHTHLAAWQTSHAAALPRICDWIRQDATHGRIWDQFWLHQFGLPLVRLAAVNPPTEVEVPTDDTEEFSLSRALATIDDTLARLAPPPLAHSGRGEQPSALQVARALAAAQARRAPVPTMEQQQAQTALAELADRAAQAFRMGDLQYAVACARRALQLSPAHKASQFTLAMALAAQGDRAAALEQFEHLLQLGATTEPHPRVRDHTEHSARTQ